MTGQWTPATLARRGLFRDAVELALKEYQESRTTDRLDARERLQWLAQRLPCATVDSGVRNSLSEAGVRFTPQAPRVGRGWFPVTAGADSKARMVFCDVRLLADGRRDEIPFLETSTARAVQNALVAVRSARRVETPIQLEFSAGDWAGPSCGLAVALAVVSALEGRPLEPRLAYTGEVATDGRIVSVGGFDDKLALLHDSWASGVLIAPGTWPNGGSRVHLVAELGEAVSRGFGTCYLDRTISDFESAERETRWADAARLADLLLVGQSREDLTDDERLRLTVARLAAANHEGDASNGRTWADEVRELLASRRDLGAEVARALGTTAIHHIDCVDFDGARRLFDALPLVEFNDKDRVHLLGPRALLAITDGDFELAVSLRRRSLESAEKSERPRCMGDLADALRRAGQLEEARAVIGEGLELIRRATRGPGQIARTQAYLMLHAVRIARSLGDLSAARQMLQSEPLNDSPDFRHRWELERIWVSGGDLLALRSWWDAVKAPLRSLPVFVCLRDAEFACAGDSEALERFVSAWPTTCPRHARTARARVPY